MTLLFPSPPKLDLPLSKGGDLAVNFLNDPNRNGQYVNYGSSVTVTLVIDTEPATTALASIAGHTAAVKIESSVTDGIAESTSWRVIVSSPTTPTTEIVAAYGKVKRFDG